MPVDLPIGRGRVTLLLLALAFMAGVSLRVQFHRISVGHLQPSADESILALQAHEIHAGARPLLFMAQPYIFPAESYLVAPFAKLLPPDARGARVPMTLLQAAALAAGLWLLRRIARADGWLVGAALMLVPSSYLLMIQCAYRPPAYTLLILLFPICLGLAGRARQDQPGLWMLILGAACGIAFSGHMLALPYVAGSLLYAVIAPDRRQWIPRAVLALVGLGLGLAPYVLALLRMPGAHEAVAIPITAHEFLVRLWAPMLGHTLPAALGFRVPEFVDEKTMPPVAPGLDTAGAVLFVLLLAVVTTARVTTHLRSATAQRAIEPALIDVVLLAVLLNLALFAGNKRADSSSYRYLLLTVLGLPYLLAWLAERGRWIGRIVAAAAAALVALNVVTAQRLMARWQEPDFPRAAGIPDLLPALNVLHGHDITNAIATYGTAYRMTFQSGGRITGAQIYNERFPTWPVPYKEPVDADPRAAYVLSDRFRNLTPDRFGRNMSEMGVTGYVSEAAGDYVVFHGFAARPDTDRAVSQSGMTAATQPASRDAARMLDGSLATFWTTDGLQRGGESVTLTWSNALPLSALRLLPGINHGDLPRRVDVSIRNGGEWHRVLAGAPARVAPCEIVRGQPRYGRAVCTLPLGRAVGDGVRIVSAEARTNRNWTLAEIEVLTPETAGDAPSAPVSSTAEAPHP